MRARTLLIVAVAAGVVAATAAARTTNPKTLVLGAGDLPAGAKRTTAVGKTGTVKLPGRVHGRVYTVAYRFGPVSKLHILVDAVATVDDSSQAHAAYVYTRKKLLVLSKKRVSTPKFGDEQLAVSTSVGTSTVAIVLVRKRETIWYVAYTVAPGTKASTVSGLVKYARKQQRRVGGG